jgi:hypothetical protein
MKAFPSFILGVLVGLAAYWLFSIKEVRRAATDARENMATNAANVGVIFNDSIDAERIKEEMERTGRVIREKVKVAGNAIADATANARITSAIKTKLIGDSGLSAFQINVDTTEGVVTLSGSVSSPEEISKAVQMAWETDGVIKVISTIQIKPK